MRSPTDLSARVAKQWLITETRESRLLSEESWPLSLSIGKPTPSMLTQKTEEVRAHLERWRSVKVGEVLWEEVSFRGGSEPVRVPIAWRLRSAEEWVAAMGDPVIQLEYERLRRIVSQLDSGFQRVVIRHRNTLQDKHTEEILQAVQLAQQLTPGCALGRPLRALSSFGIDSKFFERHRRLIIRLLDARFEGQVSDRGLEAFLDAPSEDDHWLLVVPLGEGLLAFDQQRVRATELVSVPLRSSHIVIVENEKSLHQLPRLANTVAVLGSGLDLEWMRAEWLGQRRVAYWGDLDTWGLQMLARARLYQPHVVPLLMNLHTFGMYAEASAVPEPSPAPESPPAGLSGEEAGLYGALRGRARGRLEQEFLPASVVADALSTWRHETEVP